MSLQTWLDGRRTYAVLAAGRLSLVYLWSNGVIGHEAAAAGMGIGLAGSAARAGGAKTLAAVRALGKSAPLLLLAGILVAAGCATFGGGTEEAKVAEKAAILGLGPLIPPPFNLLVPAAWGLVEALGLIFAKPKA